jgi:hypothetical protein
MGKLNQRSRVGVRSAVTSTTPTTTHEGGSGYLRDSKSELGLLALANFVGEGSFYESGDDRDQRFAALVGLVGLEDFDWVATMLVWLRQQGNLRDAPLVGAVELVAAYKQTGKDPGEVNGRNKLRKLIDDVLVRADEPGKALAYWASQYGGEDLGGGRTRVAAPKVLKKGVSDAVYRLYTERNVLKWDSDNAGVRFANVLNLAHPTSFLNAAEKPVLGTWRSDLYGHIINQRYGNSEEIPGRLPMLQRRKTLMALPGDQRLDFVEKTPGAAGKAFQDAGMTWENVGSWLPGGWTAKAWEAVIPSMGYMALIRNLRNFEKAGISNSVAKAVADKIADPAEVARSRQLPMRFLSAHRATADSVRWVWAIEQALELSLANITELSGRTLVLVDTSSSMNDTFSKDGTLKRWDAATVFGVALARRCEQADVVSYSGSGWGYSQSSENRQTKVFGLKKGESLLKAVDRWKSDGYFIGGGTDTPGAVRGHFAGHDRVVILTDEQDAYGNVDGALPASTPLYTWNLAGYRAGYGKSGSNRRHTFGGLTDASFRIIPAIEAGHSGRWPWEQD